MTLPSLEQAALIAGILGVVGALVFNGLSLRSVRRDLRLQTRLSVYSAAFDWDRLLVDRPELLDLLEADHGVGQLDNLERALAEYRLDLAEFVHIHDGMALYDAEPDFFRRLLAIPLVRRAVSEWDTHNSMKRGFRLKCKEELRAQTDPAKS